MAWSLRRPEPDEVDAALAVVQRGFEFYRSLGPPGWEPPDETRNRARTLAELEQPDTFSLIAEVKQGARPLVSGFVHMVAPDGPYDFRFRYLFVDESHWGTGLARELHGLAMEALGERTARLFTPERQARARRFYEREGWRLVGRDDESDFGMPLVSYARG